MFKRLFADADHVNVSIHIGTHDRLDAIGHLKSAIKDLKVRVGQKSDRSDVTVRDSTRRLHAHESVYDHLSTGQDEAFDVGVYIILRGDDPDRLEEAADTIETTLKTRQLTVKPADYRQQEGLVSGSPAALHYSTTAVSASTTACSFRCFYSTMSWLYIQLCCLCWALAD